MSILDDVLRASATGVKQRADSFKVLAASAPAAFVRDHSGEEDSSRATPRDPTFDELREEIKAWHASRRMDMGIDTIDDLHQCSTVSCVKTGSMMCVSRAFGLYGCVNSGRYHLCRANDDCTTRSVNDEGVLCMFSQQYLHAFINKSLYTEAAECRDDCADDPGDPGDPGEDPPTAPESYDRHAAVLLRPESAPISATRIVAAKVDAAAVKASPATDQYEDNLRYSMRVVGTRRDMNFVKDATQITTRLITAPSTAPKRGDYLALNGTDEVDTISVPTRRVVPLLLRDAPHEAQQDTARSPKRARNSFQPPRSDSLAMVPSTGPTGSPPNRIDVFEEHLTHRTLDDISELISSLFNAPFRKRLHADLQATADGVASDLLRKYYRRCADNLIWANSSTCDALIYEADHSKPRLTVSMASNLTDVHLECYTAFIYTLWDIVLRTPHFQSEHLQFRLVSHVLGALYMLDTPFVLAEQDGSTFATVLPADPYLIKHLPAQSLLRKWDVRVSVYSASHVVAVNGCTAGQVDLSMSAVSTGRNAIKHALLGISTDKERERVCRRLQKAYYGAYVEEAQKTEANGTTRLMIGDVPFGMRTGRIDD